MKALKIYNYEYLYEKGNTNIAKIVSRNFCIFLQLILVQLQTSSCINLALLQA